MWGIIEELAFFVACEGFKDNLIMQLREYSHIEGGIVTYNSADHLVI